MERALRVFADLELSLAFPWNVSRTAERCFGGRRYFLLPQFPGGSKLRRLFVAHACRLTPPSEIEHLRWAVERFRPDLIHIWGSEGHFAELLVETSTPTLLEIQGISGPYADAYFRGISPRECLLHGSMRSLLNGQSLLHRYFRYRRRATRERRVMRSARAVSGRTTWDRRVCRILAPRATYFHCDRALRPEFYDKSWPGPRVAADEPLRLVTTMRGNCYKGLETIVECAALLREARPEGAHWTLVGIREGEELVRVVEGKCRVRLRELGLHLAGRQPAGVVCEHLLRSAMYVQASLIENSPNGLCEAQLVGLPVVATNVGGVPSLVEDGTDGLVVPPSDPRAMAGAILELSEDAALSRRLSENAKSRASTRHDPARVAATQMSIYRQILSSRTSERA